MEKNTGNWLSDSLARAVEDNEQKLQAMSLRDLGALTLRDPEYAQHLRDFYPDLVDNIYVRATSDAESPQEQDAMSMLLEWGGFSSEEEAQGWLETQQD